MFKSSREDLSFDNVLVLKTARWMFVHVIRVTRPRFHVGGEGVFLFNGFCCQPLIFLILWHKFTLGVLALTSKVLLQMLGVSSTHFENELFLKGSIFFWKISRQDI